MSLRVLILHITKHREGENREGEYRGEHSEGEHSEGEYSEGEHSEGESLRAQPIANKMNEDEVVRPDRRKRSVVQLQSGVAACSKVLQRCLCLSLCRSSCHIH